MNPVVSVVAGIVINPGWEVLIAERPSGKPWAGYWEFPGGKVEAGEDDITALVREFQEELALDLSGESFSCFHCSEHETLSIRFYLCHLSRYVQPVSMEGQRWQWLRIERLSQYQFPTPNKVIIDKLLA